MVILLIVLAAACAPASAQTPAVVFDRPTAGSVVTSPLVASGTADVFEAQFHVQLVNAAGTVLADQPVQASCGTGCRGTFSTTLQFTDGTGALRLIAYELSAKDGSRVDLATVPLVGRGGTSAIPPTL